LPSRTHIPLPHLLWLISALYAIFVIYGSLVPFGPKWIPLEEALRRYAQIPFLDLGIRSRADWVSNAILFIPLGFFCFGAISESSRLTNSVVRTIGLLVLCSFLGASVEFIQLYFPTRTVSLNDLYAQAAGSMLGVAAWSWQKGRVRAIYLAWTNVRSARRRPVDVLTIYCAGFLVYSLLPLDLTISPGELYLKWKEGRILLSPYVFGSGDRLVAFGELATDILIWIPAVVLLHLCTDLSVGKKLACVTLGAFAIEFTQLFVFSRFTDVRDIFAALIAGVLTLGFFHFTKPKRDEPFFGTTQAAHRSKSPLEALALLCMTSFVLILLHWYPYNFETKVVGVSEIASRLNRYPLSAYYSGSEYQAATQALRRALAFAPFGCIGAIFGLRLSLALLIGFAIWAAAEIGQIFLPAKTTDWGDLLFVGVGISVAYFVTQKISSTTRSTVQDLETRTADPQPSLILYSSKLAIIFIVIPIVFGLAVSQLSRIPTVPYNVRELVDGPMGTWATSTVICFCAVICAIGPILATKKIHRVGFIHSILYLALAVTAICLLTASLLSATVASESIHDVVGSPIWSWPGLAEEIFRLSFLILPAVATQILCAGIVTHGRPPKFRLAALILWCLTIALFHSVVVRLAGTDNLTELMSAGGGIRSTLMISVWLALSLLPCHLLAAHLFRKRTLLQLLMMVVVIVSIPAAYAVISFALEVRVSKYDRTFSALQFLLSPGRDNYLSGTEIWWRYFVVHSALATGLVFMCWPAYRGTTDSERPASDTLARLADSNSATAPFDGQYISITLPSEVLQEIAKFSLNSDGALTEAGVIRQVIDRQISESRRQGNAAAIGFTPSSFSPSGTVETLDFWLTTKQARGILAQGKVSSALIQELISRGIQNKLLETT
jgi:VanZ family protein